MKNRDFVNALNRIGKGKAVTRAMLEKEGILDRSYPQIPENFDPKNMEIRTRNIVINNDANKPKLKTINSIEKQKPNLKETNNMTVQTFTNKEIGVILAKGLKDNKVLAAKEKEILNFAHGAFTVKHEVLTELLDGKQPYKSMKDLIDVVPVSEGSGYYSRGDDSKVAELSYIGTVGDPARTAIPVSEDKLEGFSWNIKKYGAVTRFSNELLRDSAVDFLKAFAVIHSKKQARTENKVIFATMQNGITPAPVTVAKLGSIIDEGINPSLEGSTTVVTNQDGLKKLKTLPEYSVKDTGNGVKRYFDLYPLEVFSNDELPNTATGTPIFYGSFVESVKLFEHGTEIKEFREGEFMKDISLVRGTASFDVKRFDAPQYEYKVLPLV